HGVGLGVWAVDVGGGPRLPFVWSGVSLSAVGARALRVRLVFRGGDDFALVAADVVGRPGVSVRALRLRPVSPQRLSVAGDVLWGVRWTQLDLPPVPADVSGPRIVVAECPADIGESTDVAARAHTLAEWALRTVQAHVDSEAEAMLVV